MRNVGLGKETTGTNSVTHFSGVFQHHNRAGMLQSSFREICVTYCLFLSQVIAEALARFRLEGEPTDKYQLVKVTLESGRGGELKRKILHSISFICSDGVSS